MSQGYTSGVPISTDTALSPNSNTLVPSQQAVKTYVDALGNPVTLSKGGTSANLTASNGGIFYSTGTAGAILSGTATANQMLLSGASTTPAWSTATHPATTTVNQLLYSSSTNVIAGLATANQGVLTTGTGGIPVITAIATNGQLIIGSTAGAPAAGTLTAGAGVTVTNASNSITLASVAQAYSIQTAVGNPADSTPYFMIQAVSFITGTATGGVSRFYIPVAGKINKAYGSLVVTGTLGSSQTSTLALRLNNSTDTTITSSLSATAASNTFNSTNLNITVAAGDYIEWKFTGGAWSPTNPTGVMLTATFFVE